MPFNPSQDAIREFGQYLSAANRGRDRSGGQPEHTWLTILNSFRDPVALFDRQLRHVYVNEATALATNIPSEFFRGKSMRDLGHPEHICRKIDSNLAAVFDSGQQRTVKLFFEGPNGGIHYECRMFPEFTQDDSVEYVIVVSRDVGREAARGA